MRKPNIVLITVDSLRADFVGYQNSHEKNTPFLDAFAKRSYVYLNAIAPGIPTFFYFPSIMTGTLPFAYGTYLGIPDTKEAVTIAEVLKKNGYATLAIIADNPALYSIYNYTRGFDEYDDGYEETNKIYLSLGKFLWKLRQATPEPFIRFIEMARPFIKSLFVAQQFSIPGRKLNQKVKKLFASQEKEPFFLWLHYMDAHVPYYSGINTYFFKTKNPIERTIKKAIFFKELATSLRKMRIKNQEVLEIFKEAYRSSVRCVDEALQEIVLFLQAKYPNTVFIITSDHGEAFMEHGMYHHEPFFLYNELIRIPLLIHLPSGKAKKVTETVSTLSIAKTICSILHINNKNFLGTDVVGHNNKSELNHISRILYRCRSPHVRLGILENKTRINGFGELWSYTTPECKYVVESNGKKEEFYDLRNDPLEKINIEQKNIKAKIEASKILKKYIN